MFLEHQILILERFLRDHVTETVEMAAKNPAFPLEEYITF